MLKQTFDIGDNVTYKHPLDGIFEGVSATIPGKVIDINTVLGLAEISVTLGTIGNPRIVKMWAKTERLQSDMHIRNPNWLTDKLAAAEKIAAKDWHGWIFDEWHDKYFDSFDDLLEDYENEDDEDIPNWTWATKPSLVKIAGAIDLIESKIGDLDAEDVYESDDFAGVEELQWAIDTFNQLNKDKVVYNVDRTKAIIYSED